jgi:hypothetical protein
VSAEKLKWQPAIEARREARALIDGRSLNRTEMGAANATSVAERHVAGVDVRHEHAVTFEFLDDGQHFGLKTVILPCGNGKK